MTTFRAAFENVAPRYVSAAWDYAHRSPAVELLWVYVTQVGGSLLLQRAYYQVGGALREPHELDTAIPNVDTSADGQDWLFDQLLDQTLALVQVVGDKSEIPNRMILRFRPADHDLQANFSYEPLQPGSAVEAWVPAAQLAE